MDYVNRVALTVLYAMVTIVMVTSVMSFVDVEPEVYNPYLYFLMLLLFFHLTLS
jgi:hypothetical protein